MLTATDMASSGSFSKTSRSTVFCDQGRGAFRCGETGSARDRRRRLPDAFARRESERSVAWRREPKIKPAHDAPPNRCSGQSSNSSSTRGSVTSIGLDISPRASSGRDRQISPERRTARVTDIGQHGEHPPQAR